MKFKIIITLFCTALLFSCGSSKNATNKKKNTDILKRIIEEIKDRDVDLKYIRGHTKKQDIHSKGNERADFLATSCL